MTAMNDEELNTYLYGQIDKLTEEANRYRAALQDIRELISVTDSYNKSGCVLPIRNIALDALEGE